MDPVKWILEKTKLDVLQKSYDNKMLAKIAGIDLNAKEATYHHSGRKLYLARAARAGMSSENAVTSEQTSTERHQDAFSKLKDHIH